MDLVTATIAARKSNPKYKMLSTRISKGLLDIVHFPKWDESKSKEAVVLAAGLSLQDAIFLLEDMAA